MPKPKNDKPEMKKKETVANKQTHSLQTIWARSKGNNLYGIWLLSRLKGMRFQCKYSIG